MSFWSRLRLIFKAKASKQLDKAEDPREMVDYSYERQLELLQQVRKGIAEVTTARKRIELQAQGLQGSADRLHDQAKQALGANREDLAREALGRRATIARELSDLQLQHEQLKGQEDQMIESSRRLEERIRALRTRKETMKATYSAAEARAKVGEAVSGISDEMGDLGLSLQRAEDKIAQMQARAGAVEELMASGALEDLSTPEDRIQSELDKGATQTEVELELAKLKGELGQGQPQSVVEQSQDAQTSEGPPES
ncbi:MAG TPA: PspA/IM30 family protein [Actinomycetota bacterium]|nr:PspA/IM30 family protein [Actinomycetota bacterium]